MNYPIKSISRFGEIKATLDQPTLYIFDGNQGQYLSLGIGDGISKAELLTPSGEGLAMLYSGEWKGVLPESGIYRVLVSPKHNSTDSAIQVNLSQQLTESSNSSLGLKDWRLSEYAYKSSRVLTISEQAKTSLEISLSQEQIQPLKVSCQKDQTLVVKANAVTLAIKSPMGQVLALKEGSVSTTVTQDGIYQVLVIGEDYPITTPVTLSLQ